MTITWVELLIASILASIITGMTIAFWLRNRINKVIEAVPDKLSDALAEHLKSEEGKSFFLGEGAIHWIQNEIQEHTSLGKVHLKATGRAAESIYQADLVPRLSNLIVDWALSKELEMKVVSWCKGLHQNHSDKKLADIIPEPITTALNKGIIWVSKVPQKNNRWITLFIQNLRTQEKLIGDFISERTLDEIMDTVEARLRFVANNTDILDHPVILDTFLPWWAEYSKEKISFWESAGVGLFNTFKLGLPVNPADGRSMLKWWSDVENQIKTKETLQEKINDLLASDSRVLLRDKIQSQRNRRVCDFISEIPKPVFDSFESALTTEVASPEWEHWIFGSSEKLLNFAINRTIAEYLDDLNGWRPDSTMSVEEALSENVKSVFSWCRSKQMEPEIKRWLTHLFEDWLSDLRFESGITRPLLEKSLNKAHYGLEMALDREGRLRKVVHVSLLPAQTKAKKWNTTLGGGLHKLPYMAAGIGFLTAAAVGLLAQII